MGNDNMGCDEDEAQLSSKEARMNSCQYCELVFHPFVSQIRMKLCGWDCKGEVPDNLKVISWMNSTNG